MDVSARDRWVLRPEVPKVPSVYARSCRTGPNGRNRGGLCRGRPMFARGVRIPGARAQPEPELRDGVAGHRGADAAAYSLPRDCAGWSPRPSPTFLDKLILKV